MLVLPSCINETLTPLLEMKMGKVIHLTLPKLIVYEHFLLGIYNKLYLSFHPPVCLC